MTKAAATVADDLENLNNNDLRAKCVQYGLPNVPVTDTSRKLLIRKLRTAMEGGAVDIKANSTKNKSSRRETINVVTKVTETEQRETSPKKTRGPSARRTIAAPSEPEPAPTVEVTVREVTNRRRSRTTPVPVEKVTAATSKRKSSVLIEDDEDDDSDIQIVRNERDFATRSSRSPSLAKSKMVTTSFKPVITEETIVEESTYTPKEVIIPIRRETNYEYSSKPTIHTQTVYEQARPIVRRSQEIETSAYSSSRPSVQLSRPSLAPSTSSTNYTSSTSRRYTTSGYKPQTEYISTTSSSSNYKPLSTTTTSYRYGNENSEEDEEEEDMNAPFLSDFARRLSRLKAEPLATSVVTGTVAGNNGSQYRDTQRYYTTTSISARRGINKRSSLGESFMSLWIALDRQYGLSKYLAVIAITLVILFLYIMLVQN